MIAEIYLQDCLGFCFAPHTDINIQKIHDVELYDKFVDNKLKIYFQDKALLPFGNPIVETMITDQTKLFLEQHENLAVQFLFSSEAIANSTTKVDISELFNVGIILKSSSGHFTFVHNTFAEYFFARFLTYCILEDSG